MSGIDGKALGRRQFVCVTGAGAVLGLAGCTGETPADEQAPSGNGEDADDADDAGDGGDDGGNADEEEFASHPGDEPREVPAGHICNGVCGMEVIDYPDWNAQLAHANGMGAFFCTSGCMVGYLAAPDHVGAIDAEVVGAWVTDFESGDLIDGTEAYYALEDDIDRMEEPMRVNPRPFAERSDAVAYVEEYPDLEESDVVRLDEFDLETARIYRGYALPDSGT